MPELDTPTRRRRAPTDLRRRELVLAAYARIASHGFEGLRTRDVAGDVGVNIATLHYHFSTKEALIAGVVEHALQAFNATLPGTGSPAEQLRIHLAALRRLLKREVQLCTVLAELAMRAPRDPVIASLMYGMDKYWDASLQALIKGGVEQGGLSPALNVSGAAALTLAAIKGICMPMDPALRAQRIDETFHELERTLGLIHLDGPTVRGPQDDAH